MYLKSKNRIGKNQCYSHANVRRGRFSMLLLFQGGVLLFGKGGTTTVFL